VTVDTTGEIISQRRAGRALHKTGRQFG